MKWRNGHSKPTLYIYSPPHPPQNASGFLQILLSQAPRRETIGSTGLPGAGALVDRILRFINKALSGRHRSSCLCLWRCWRIRLARITDAFVASAAGGRMLVRPARQASHDQLLPAAFWRCLLASLNAVMSTTGRISNPVASKTMAGCLVHKAIASFRSSPPALCRPGRRTLSRSSPLDSLRN